MAHGGRARLTVGSLMLLVLLVGVVLGLFRYLKDERDWIERVLVFHAVGLGLIVPLATFLTYSWLAAGRPDQERTTEMTVASGCVAWVFVFGSLVFWFIIMVIGVTPD